MLRRFFAYYRPHRKLFLLDFGCAVVSGLLELSFPIAVGLMIDELLPEIGRTYRISDDPRRRVIGGTSSGAICAFTVAWERPESFQNVISMIGSYGSIGYRPAQNGQPLVPGGDLYPTLIRKSPIKPLRIFLQDGSDDLDNPHGNWFLANQQMLSALQFANAFADRQERHGPRYDVKHVWGDGAHSDDHGGALLPDILRWIWREQAAAGRKTESGRQGTENRDGGV